MFFHFLKRISVALPPLPLALGDCDSSHWVHAGVKTLPLGEREHRRERHLDVPVRAVCQVMGLSLVIGFDLSYQIFTVHCPEVPHSTLHAG